MDRGDDFLLVEVSERALYDEAHLPGAILFRSVEELEEEIPGKDREVILYSKNLGDHSSLRVTRELTAMGYLHAYEYEGGKEDWTSNGLPTETTTETTTETS